jgi:hypothetical protein
MDLFNQISGHLSENYSITINIEKLPGEKQEMKVAVLPKIDTFLFGEDELYLQPIILKGDARKLDETFFESIKDSLMSLNDTCTSINKLEEQLDSLLGKAKSKVEAIKSDKPVEKNVVYKNKEGKAIKPTEEVPATKNPEVKKASPAQKRTFERVDLIVKEGFKFNEETNRYEKGEAYISEKELSLLSNEAWENFLKLFFS